MTYKKQNISVTRHSVKPGPNGSGIIRAARRLKANAAYLQQMREWSERIVRELEQEAEEGSKKRLGPFDG
jgi:hypothetical protein